MARAFRRRALAAPEPVGAILDRAGESRFARARPPIDEAVWREAVGPRIAERAHPVSLAGGVLLLRVASSVWAHEISLLSGEVCARLAARGIQARELRFRVGSVPEVDRPAERRVSRSVPTPAALPGELASALRGLDDESLREAIGRAAAANLAWQAFAGPAPQQEISEARRAARAPRSAAGESAPSDRTSPAARARRPGTSGGGRGRSS